MPIDFRGLTLNGAEPVEFAKQFTLSDLKSSVNDYLNMIRDMVKDLTDAQLTFEPVDQDANDPYAKTTQEVNMAWSVAHLVLHVTASLEEGAAISSILARGIPVEARSRYEPDWQLVTRRSQVLQRIEESRRICLAYLEAWPDEPHLDVYRKFPEGSRFAEMLMNAPASYLFSLKHLDGHLDQFRRTIQQASEATRISSV